MDRLRTFAVLGLVLLAGLSGCFGGSKAKPSPTPTESPREAPFSPASGSAEPAVNGTLRADFEYTPVSPTENQLVHFADKSYDERAEITQTAWNFGDGFGTTEPNPVHAWETPGVYEVLLRVRSGTGATATASHFVSVRPAGGGTGPGTATPGPGGGGGVGDPFHFGVPVLVRESRGGEPSLAIDARGVIWVSTIGVLDKSTNGGRSFQPVTYPGLIAGDSHVVVDQDDRVWVSDLVGTGIGLGGVVVPVLGPSTVWRSTDGGQTWLGNPAASDTVLNDRQWLAAHDEGTAYLFYHVLPLGGRITKTVDGGLTWFPLVTGFAPHGYPFLDKRDGTLYVVESEGGTIRAGASRDGGQSFSFSTVANRRTSVEAIFVVGAADDAGNAYVAWVDSDSGRHEVYLSHSVDQGRNWKGPILVSAGPGTNVMPWIAAGKDGNVVLAWYGTNATAHPERAGAKTEWHVYAARSSNAHDAKPVFETVRATANPVHIGSVCISGTGCAETGADRDLLDFLSVEVHPDGRAVIAFAEDGSSDEAAAYATLQTGGPRFR